MHEKEISKAAELSIKYFRNGLYCSESILRAFNEIYMLGLPEDAYKISTGFGSGLSGSGCVCGTVTGATMVFGLAAGRNKSYESENIVYSAVKKLHDRFRDEHKALCCRVLTKNVKWGSARHNKQCESFILDVAMWTEEILRTDLREHLPADGIKSVPVKNIFTYILSKLLRRDY